MDVTLKIYSTFTKKYMGLVYADIELINAEDIALARNYKIGEEEVKRLSISILVDTGAYNLCINESIQSQLKLPFIEKRSGETADGRRIECDVVGPVHVKFKNRNTICTAMVLSGDNEPLLGAIPLEDMDVLINPLKQELVVNPDHPYFAQMK